MKCSLYLTSLLFLFISCEHSGSVASTKEATTDSIFTSEKNTLFSIRFADDERTHKLLMDSTIYGSASTVGIVEKEGLPALSIETSKEFSDTYLDMVKLFGHSIDFSKSRYLSMKILVPKDSWISALKLNFRDKDNFGGVGEIANNFFGNKGRWIDVVVDIQDLVDNYKSWQGTGNPLSAVELLSLNPYNAHQAESSKIFIHNIHLRETMPDGNHITALAQRVKPQENIPFLIDFDNEEKLQQYMAFRSFESSFQAMRKGVGGNQSMAIRIKGSDENKHIAFLPKLHEMTGKPVDFTKVSRINFSYFLTEDSDDFKSASLYLVSENWEDILYDENVFSAFEKGKWIDASIELKDLNLELVRGEQPVLPEVYELRFALEYFSGRKNIEMWLDNFQWE